MLGGSISGGRTNVRVVVVGDRATGKSSLITAAATETFPEEVPPVLPPTRLPADLYPDNVPVTIIDTSSRFLLLFFWSLNTWFVGYTSWKLSYYDELFGYDM